MLSLLAANARDEETAAMLPSHPLFPCKFNRLLKNMFAFEKIHFIETLVKPLDWTSAASFLPGGLRSAALTVRLSPASAE